MCIYIFFEHSDSSNNDDLSTLPGGGASLETGSFGETADTGSGGDATRLYFIKYSPPKDASRPERSHSWDS